MKFGAAMWPFRWDPPYDGELRRIAGLGFRAVELIAWTPTALLDYYTPATVAHLRGALEDTGLELAEFVGTPERLASADPAERAEAVEFFAGVVRTGAALGATTINSVSAHPFAIRVPPITGLPLAQEWQVDYPAGLDWAGNWRDYVEAVKRCVEECERAGVRWAIEPHPYRYVASTASMLRLAEHVDSEALGFNVDPSHMFPLGEIPHAAIQQLGAKVFNCHLSDNDGDTNVHWRPGKGKIDWGALLRALRDVGFDGCLTIELEDVPGVSRRGEPSTPAFDRENRLAMAYLRAIAEADGIAIDR
jgi:sugar phosphate isomerase/epimerase